jgi:hypothetical protein
VGVHELDRLYGHGLAIGELEPALDAVGSEPLRRDRAVNGALGTIRGIMEVARVVRRRRYLKAITQPAGGHEAERYDGEHRQHRGRANRATDEQRTVREPHESELRVQAARDRASKAKGTHLVARQRSIHEPCPSERRARLAKLTEQHIRLAK